MGTRQSFRAFRGVVTASAPLAILAVSAVAAGVVALGVPAAGRDCLPAQATVQIQERAGLWTTVRGTVRTTAPMDGEGTRVCRFSTGAEDFQAVLVGDAGREAPELEGRTVEVSGYVDLAGHAPRMYLYETGQLRVLH